MGFLRVKNRHNHPRISNDLLYNLNLYIKDVKEHGRELKNVYITPD